MSRLAIFFLMAVATPLAVCLAWLGLETLGSNLLGWFLLFLGIAYPVGGLLYYIISRKPFWGSARSGRAKYEDSGDWSFWLILPGFLVVFFAAPLEWIFLPYLMPRLPWMQGAGLGLIMAAMVMRVWTRAHLRGQYSGHVEVSAGQSLVQSGPYRFIRHPGYTGFLLMTLGVAVGYSSLIGLAAVPVLLLPGLAYRMKVEENLLTKQFGDEYRTYQRKSKKLIPGIW